MLYRLNHVQEPKYIPVTIIGLYMYNLFKKWIYIWFFVECGIFN